MRRSQPGTYFCVIAFNMGCFGIRELADGNRALNIDAGAEGGRFYLATGGNVTNAGTRLWGEVRLPALAAP